MLKSILVVVLTVCLGSWLVPVASAYEDGDWQTWSNNSVEVRLADRWKLSVATEFRVGDDVSQLYEEFPDLGLTYEPAGWLRLGANYRHIYKRSGEAWKMEKRPHLNATLVCKWRGFEFQDRSRLERRMHETAEDEWRYRNRFTLLLPSGICPCLGRPYLALEAFVDFDDEEVNRYRGYVGFKRKLFGPFNMDLSYFLQSTKSGGEWTEYHVARIGLKVKT